MKLFDLVDRVLADQAARAAAGLPEPWLAEAERLGVPCHYGEGDRIIRHDPDGRRWEVTGTGQVICEIEPGWPEIQAISSV
ncbi:hypothetical protein [Bosea minatitlanensis]|uniref:Uncharacterized protein n=1 Tax=Bosea minatitlanensis TaxID=128782 RepID=A0ABW0F1N0_9HYPH|nr:hypothetical protein [Bosea minatitlanensis]MCT4494046.1 hypothetical protein [Bosea minatitlanensis]